MRFRLFLDRLRTRLGGADMLQVSMPAASHDLTTLAAVKQELNITSRSDDDWISGQITQFSKAAMAFCGRVFARESLIETIRLPRSIAPPDHLPPPLALSRFPVSTVESVLEDGIELSGTDWELRDADCGFLTRLDGSDRPKKWVPSKIIVSYTAGWVLPGNIGRNLPEDIEAAIISAVKASIFSRTRDQSISKESVVGVGSVDYSIVSAVLPADALSILNGYRVITV